MKINELTYRCIYDIKDLNILLQPPSDCAFTIFFLWRGLGSAHMNEYYTTVMPHDKYSKKIFSLHQLSPIFHLFVWMHLQLKIRACYNVYLHKHIAIHWMSTYFHIVDNKKWEKKKASEPNTRKFCVIKSKTFPKQNSLRSQPMYI